MNYINKETSNKLFDEIIKTNNYNEEEYKLLTLIEFFTLDKENRKKYLENIDDMMYDMPAPYNPKTKAYTVGDVDFDRIDESLKFDGGDDSIHKELVSINRYGKCHKGAVKLINIDNSYILSGYMNANGKLYFHSVVQLGDYILDYTKNLIMKKDDYFRLTDFKLIQRISKEQFFEDQKNILSNFIGIDLRIYLAFRDEIVEELNNKKLILKE